MLIQNRVIENGIRLKEAAQYIRNDPSILATHEKFFRRFLGPWFNLNQKANDWNRTLAFWSHLEQGNDVLGAQQKLLQSMFDFSDFTSVEETWFRRMIPFYSWMRNNLGYQMQSFVQRPMYATLAPKLKEALEEATAGEDAVPENLRPSWMRDSLVTQIGKDPESRFGLAIGQGVLPQVEIVNMLLPLVGEDGVQKFLHYFGSGLNPVATTPLQVATGVDFFSKKTIAAGPRGDISPLDFTLKQAVPVAGFAGSVGDAFGRSPGEGVGRFLVGGRVQAFDDARITSSREREFKDEETRLRSSVRRAERAGDAKASQTARASLLRLYEQMAKIGLDIPNWAEEQLATLTANG